MKKSKKRHAAKKGKARPAVSKPKAHPAVKKSGPHPKMENYEFRSASDIKKRLRIVAAIIVILILIWLVWPRGGTPGVPRGEAPGTQVNIQPADILSGVTCTGDNIEGTITNALDSKLDMADVRVLLDGEPVDSRLLKCDKTVLEPGESTKCSSLQGILPVAGEKEVSVVLGEANSDKKTVTC